MLVAYAIVAMGKARGTVVVTRDFISAHRFPDLRTVTGRLTFSASTRSRHRLGASLTLHDSVFRDQANEDFARSDIVLDACVGLGEIQKKLIRVVRFCRNKAVRYDLRNDTNDGEKSIAQNGVPKMVPIEKNGRQSCGTRSHQ